jgi:hypothetical protein
MNDQLEIPNSGEAEVSSGDFIINIDDLRLTQDFAAKAKVKKVVVSVPVQKPDRQQFFRVHPDENWRMMTWVLELKEEKITYLIDPSLWGTETLEGEIAAKVLFTCITTTGNLFIFPVKMADANGNLDQWNLAKLEAANRAMKVWVRLVYNSESRKYDVFEAKGSLEGPQWPEITFQKMISLAFKDQFIRSLDHPVIKKLRGLE